MAVLPTYFYVFPFAISGDTAAVPTLISPPESPQPVNYQQGFTLPYEEVLGVDPDAIPIPRDQMNKIYLDITNNIKQYQIQGVPNWIDPSQNIPAATPFPYTQYARVFYNNEVYENQLLDPAVNTAVPGTAASGWLRISGNATGVKPGTIIDFAGIHLQDGCLPCDGSPYLRADYPALFEAITSVQTVTLTAASAAFTVSSTFGLYVGMAIESTGFAANTTVISIIGTTVTASATAGVSGATAVRFFQYGPGNGTTLFNTPALSGYVTAGQGGAGLAAGTGVISAPGQFGGQSARSIPGECLPSHTHTATAESRLRAQTTLKTGGPPNYIVKGTSGISPIEDPVTNTQVFTSVTVNPTGSGSAFNVVQPTAITYKQIQT